MDSIRRRHHLQSQPWQSFAGDTTLGTECKKYESTKDSCSSASVLNKFTNLGSLIGAPGITIPAPHNPVGGIPLGVELDAVPGNDEALLRLALTIEEILKQKEAPPLLDLVL